MPAFTDAGSPVYDRNHAAKMSAMGVPIFACTPDRLTHLMAAALSRQDLHLWAELRGMKLGRAAEA